MSTTDSPASHLSTPGRAHLYSPLVGDRFYKPAATYRNMITGQIFEIPDKRAEVTMTDGRHVVCIINGLEYELSMKEFIRLAKKTLANGATLRRAGHNGAHQRPAESERETQD